MTSPSVGNSANKLNIHLKNVATVAVHPFEISDETVSPRHTHNAEDLAKNNAASTGVERVKIERSKKKRVGTQILASSTQKQLPTPPPSRLSRLRVQAENEEKIDKFKKFIQVLKELKSYGEKVINASEKTIDLRSKHQHLQRESSPLSYSSPPSPSPPPDDLQLMQMVKSLKGNFCEEDEQEMNSLVGKFESHMEKRIDITKQAQRYD